MNGRALTVAAVVGFALLGWFAVAEYQDKLRAAAQLEVYRRQIAEASAASRRAESALVDAERRARIASDSLGALTRTVGTLQDSLDALVATAGAREVAAAAELDALIVQVRAELPEPVRHLADSVVVKVAVLRQTTRTLTTAFEEQRAALTDFMASSATALAAMEARAEAAESLADRRAVEVERERAARLAAEALATPGVLERVRNSLPLFSVQGTVAAAIGFTAGVLVTR